MSKIKSTNKLQLLKRLLSYTKGATKYMFFSVLTSVLTVVFSLLTPLLFSGSRLSYSHCVCIVSELSKK